MRKTIIATFALIAACAGAIVLLAKDVPKRVPVGLVWVWNLTGDTAPVETHLYEYIRAAGTEFNYETTGKHMSFRFPKTYYSYEENQAGGPQRLIGLSVDRETLHPLARVIIENEDITSAKSIAHYYRKMDNNNRSYASRNLAIVIDSNANRKEWPLEAQVFENLIESGYLKRTKRLCGFEFARRRSSHSTSLEDVRKDDQGVVGLYSNDLFAVSVGGGARNSSLKCLKHAGTCRHAFHYREVSVEYNIPKDKLCQHAKLSGNVSTLLDKYRIQ